MMILIDPAPSPYREVDAADVIVTRVVRSGAAGLLSAYGTLRSEDRVSYVLPIDPGEGEDSFYEGSREPGPEYRVAHQREDGGWQAEQTNRREPPPEPVMSQVRRILAHVVYRGTGVPEPENGGPDG
jgi:hypothetical protein